MSNFKTVTNCPKCKDLGVVIYQKKEMVTLGLSEV